MNEFQSGATEKHREPRLFPTSQGLSLRSAGSTSYLNARHRGSPGSPEWEIGGKDCGCVWESLAHSPLMIRSG